MLKGYFADFDSALCHLYVGIFMNGVWLYFGLESQSAQLRLDWTMVNSRWAQNIFELQHGFSFFYLIEFWIWSVCYLLFFILGGDTDMDADNIHIQYYFLSFSSWACAQPWTPSCSSFKVIGLFLLQADLLAYFKSPQKAYFQSVLFFLYT